MEPEAPKPKEGLPGYDFHSEAVKQLITQMNDRMKDIAELRNIVTELQKKPLDVRPGDGWIERDVFPAIPFKPYERQADDVVATSRYTELFDIFDIDIDNRTFKIVTNQYCTYIAGSNVALTASDPMLADEYGSDFVSCTIGATGYVYVMLDRGGNNSYIHFATSIPAPTDSTEIFPLWYIPVVSTKIVASGIIDMRGSLHWDAGA